MKSKMISTVLCSALLSAGLMLTPQVTFAQEAKKVEVKKVNVKVIDLEKAKELYAGNNTLFLDARPMKLYSKGTIMGAVNASLKTLNVGMLPVDKNTTIVTFCNGADCEKSSVLAEKLQKIGYKNVLVYVNGYPEWEENKQPSMALKREAKVEAKEASTNLFKKTIDSTEVAGVEVYLLPEDDEPNEDGAIDQFWFMDQLQNNTLPKGITIVDVRKAEKYNTQHIEGAINIPFDSKTETMDISKLPKDGLIVFYCNTGLKSMDARGSLTDEQAERVLTLDATYKCDKDNKNCVLTPNEAI